MQFIKNLLINLGILVVLLVIFNLVAHDLLQRIYADFGTIFAVFALSIVVITAIPRKKY